MRKTQVVIVGGGPSGLLLSQLLCRQGVACVVLERHSRDHVERRIRAGLLEWTTVELLNEAGVGGRMMREGLVHDGFVLALDGRTQRIDLKGLAGRQVLVYGQTELQRDLGEVTASRVVWDAREVSIRDFASSRPQVTYRASGAEHAIECDFIAGCDGYHGTCRASVPRDKITQYERVLPFGWLGVLADVRPVHDELIYSNHVRGFALCSMRSRTRSRYYVQCPATDKAEAWPDERFWSELQARLPEEYAARLATAASIEKSIAPLRSFVAEPMRFGRLFLAGDAAHIVPPAGAKGLNLAAADVRLLSEALAEYYRSGSETLLEEYSPRALARVWKATRFSWWFSTLTHKFSDDPLARKLQLAEFMYLAESDAACRVVAENYAGLPLRVAGSGSGSMGPSRKRKAATPANSTRPAIRNASTKE
jgi:p-hydroxybenzoate 3-monooxygenase